MLSISSHIDQFSRRHGWACLLAIMALVAGAYSLSLEPFWNPNADGVEYLVVGRYLAEGKDIRELWSSVVLPPPLAGAYLAVGYLLPGRPWFNHQALQLTAYLAMVAATYLLMRRLAGPSASLLVAVLTGLNCEFINGSSQYMSEGMYTALSMAALWAGASVFRGGQLNWPAVVATAVLAGLATMTRTIGLMLVPAALAMLISRDGAGVGRLKRLVAAGVVIAACAAPQAWLAYWTRGCSPPHSYGADMMGEEGSKAQPLLEDLPHRLATYGRYRIDSLFAAMVTPAHSMHNTRHAWLWPGYLLCLPWAAAACYGWWRQFRSRRSMVEAYSLLYMGVLLVWPYFEGERFLLPIVPLGWYYVITAYRDAAARWRWPAWPVLASAAALVCAAAGTCIYEGVRGHRDFEATADMRDDILAVGDYLAGRRDVPVREIVISAQTRRTTLALVAAFGRMAPPIPRDEKSGNGLERNWPAWTRLVVLEIAMPKGGPGPATAPGDDRLWGAHGEWRLVMRSGGLQVYERVGAKTESAQHCGCQIVTVVARLSPRGWRRISWRHSESFA